MTGDDNMDLSNGADDVLELDTQITALGDEEFNRLMNGEDITEPPKPAVKPPPVKQAPKTKTPPAKVSKTADAPAASEEMDTIDDTEKFFGQQPAKKKTEKTEKHKGKEDEEGEEEELPWPNKETEDDDRDDNEDTGDEPDEETTKLMLSSTYQHLVKTGVWKEVEGEGFDPNQMTSEVYAQIAAQQATEAAHEAFGELMDRTGKYRTILDHALRKGNPDEIIDLFKEEHKMNALDPKLPTDQKEMIRRYHTDIMEWDTADVDNFINKAEADNELEKYERIARKGYQRHIDSTIATKNAELKRKEDKATADREAFESTMSNVIDQLKLPGDRADMFKRALFEPAFKIAPDRTITAFQAKMMQVQNNPQEYFDLVHFIMDKKEYLHRATAKKENTQVQQQFKIKLNGGGITPVKSESNITRQRNSKEQEELQFFSPVK
jgi:hypothetical protein